jgi:hypothetical protein
MTFARARFVRHLQLQWKKKHRKMSVQDERQQSSEFQRNTFKQQQHIDSIQKNMIHSIEKNVWTNRKMETEITLFCKLTNGNSSWTSNTKEIELHIWRSHQWKQW